MTRRYKRKRKRNKKSRRKWRGGKFTNTKILADATIPPKLHLTKKEAAALKLFNGLAPYDRNKTFKNIRNTILLL